MTAKPLWHKPFAIFTTIFCIVAAIILFLFSCLIWLGGNGSVGNQYDVFALHFDYGCWTLCAICITGCVAALRFEENGKLVWAGFAAAPLGILLLIAAFLAVKHAQQQSSEHRQAVIDLDQYGIKQIATEYHVYREPGAPQTDDASPTITIESKRNVLSIVRIGNTDAMPTQARPLGTLGEPTDCRRVESTLQKIRHSEIIEERGSCTPHMWKNEGKLAWIRTPRRVVLVQMHGIGSPPSASDDAFFSAIVEAIIRKDVP